MPHFYVSPSNIKNNFFVIDGEQFHYLSNVRRFSAGDEINIFDGLGNSFLARIDTVAKKQISGVILSTKIFQLPKTKVSLYTAIPKGERFEWLIEKSSEIGVCKIIPVIYSRSIITDISLNKIERYKKISVSASSQSWRADIMDIGSPVKFLSVVETLSKQKNILNIIPWESEEKTNIIQLLNNRIDIKNVNIFIGPEGGFEDAEIHFALKNNFNTVTLGKNILRVETAALISSGIVLTAIG